MSTRLAFQTQLASIMEVLANAAVAEICKLVDDDYAVVSLQMSQCQRENKALKRKLHLLELKMARGSAERRLRESALNSSRPGGRAHVNITDKYRGGPSTSSGSVFDRQMNMGLWPDGSSTADPISEPMHPVPLRPDETVDVQVVEQEAMLVKEERMDDALAESDHIALIGEDGVVECGPRGGGGPSPPEPPPAMAQSSEPLPQPQQPQPGPRTRTQPSGRSRGLEVSGSSTLLKTDNDAENTAGSASSQGQPANPNAAFDVFGESDGPLVGAFFNNAEEEGNGRPSCSYAAGGGASSGGGALFQPLPASGGIGHHRLLAAKQEVIDVDSEEGEELLDWEGAGMQGNQNNTPAAPPPPHALLRPNDIAMPSTSDLNGWGRGGGRDGEFGAFPSSSRGGGGGGSGGGATKALHRTSAREKLYICNFCGKAFNRPKKVEIHQRVHTGEKPFRCATCGKMFSEAGNLKKHQRVHTGEKPFSCQLCGKGFAWIRNLRTHQQRNHPDVYTEDMACFS